MRLRFVFKLRNKGAVLPFHHQELVRSLFEMAVGKDYNLDDLAFNYSGLKGQTRVGREGLHYYSRRVTLVLSSTNHELLQAIIERIFTFGHLYLGSLLLEPELVERELLESPKTGTAKYLCISPIVITHSNSQIKNKFFVPPTSNDFSELLKESTQNRMNKHQIDLNGHFGSFKLSPDLIYLDRLSQRGKKFARIYNVNFTGRSEEVRGYTLPFKLEATEDVQNFIFKNGLGEFTQHGFGMVDLATDKPTQREIFYNITETYSEKN